jgi:hypothetical protein
MTQKSYNFVQTYENQILYNVFYESIKFDKFLMSTFLTIS